MNREEALTGAITALTDADDTGWVLHWDGATYTLAPADTPLAVDAFDTPLTPQPIREGWWVGSRTMRNDNGDLRSGICVAAFDVHNPDTGEVDRVFTILEAHRGKISRLDIPMGDVHHAGPGSRRNHEQLLSLVNTVLAASNKHRFGADTDRTWVACTAIPMLGRLIDRDDVLVEP